MTRQDRSTLPTTRRSLPIALIRAREAVMTPIREMLAGTGLTEQQWRVLRVLDEGGAMDASRLAGLAGLMPSSLTRIVASMVQQGLVTRQTPAHDRRRQQIAIADRGAEILDANLAKAAEIAETYQSRLGVQNYEALLDLLDLLAREPGK